MNKIFTFMISVLSLSTVLAQEVPYSNHVEDQVVQGPCYIFAAVAAMETKALQAKGKTSGGHSDVDFNEWRYWSDCVLGTDASGDPISSVSNFVRKPMEHMNSYGAMQTLQQFKTTSSQVNSLPNVEGCGNFKGIASFICNGNGGGPISLNSSETSNYDINIGGNLDWCNTYGGYQSSNNLNSCTDDTGLKSYEFSQIYISPDYTFNINIVTTIQNTSAQDVIDQLSNGNGVIAVINNYRSYTCQNNTVNAQHAIYIYKHENGTFYFKDSWPGQATINGTVTTTVYNSWNIALIAFANGDAQCVNNCDDDEGPTPPEPVANTPCDFNISGSSTINCSGSTTYSLTGGTGEATNISWSVPSTLSIVGSSTGSTLRVRARNANCGSNISGSISVTYNDINSCSSSKSFTINGSNVTKPTSIQLNGPISGSISDVCAGSVIQLVAVDNNAIHCPIYEWSISGATILNGQGTREINILTNSIDNAFQSYSVRVKKSCGSFTTSTTRTGYLDDCSSDSGGGIGIFPTSSSINPDNFGDRSLFQQNPTLELMQVEIVDLSGKKVDSFILEKNCDLILDRSLKKGLLIIKFYDEKNNLLGVKKTYIF